MIDSDLELLRDRLFTGRYQTWRPGDGVPVRTSVGEPKFWRGPPVEFVRALAPFGLLHLPADEFDDAYLARLDRYAESIVRQLVRCARKHPGQPLVLLCFEDVLAGDGCHRRDFATWAEARYGLVVPELDDRDEPGWEQLRLPD